MVEEDDDYPDEFYCLLDGMMMMFLSLSRMMEGLY